MNQSINQSINQLCNSPGNALVMKALGSRRFCSPYFDASKAGSLRFFLVHGSSHCSTSSSSKSSSSDKDRKIGNNTVAIKVTAEMKENSEEEAAILFAPEKKKRKFKSLEAKKPKSKNKKSDTSMEDSPFAKLKELTISGAP